MNIAKKFSKKIHRLVVLFFAVSILTFGVAACSHSTNPTLFTQEAGDTPENVDLPVDSVVDSPVVEVPDAQAPVASNPPVVTVDPTPSALPPVSTDDVSKKNIGMKSGLPRRGVKKGITSLEEVESTINELKENNSLLILDAQIESKKVHGLLDKGIFLKDTDTLQQFLDELIPLTQKMQNLRGALRQIHPSLAVTVGANPSQDSFVGKAQLKIFEELNGQAFLDASVLGDRLIDLYQTSIFPYEDENGDVVGYVSFFDFAKDDYGMVNVRDLSFLTDLERSL